MLLLKRYDFPKVIQDSSNSQNETKREIREQNEPEKPQLVEITPCMEEVVPRRNCNLKKDKCYIRTAKPHNKSLMISIYIGTDIVRLLEIDPLKRITVYCSREHKNFIELEQNDKNNGYKIYFKNSSNCLVVTFACPSYLNIHPMNTKEVDFNFTNKPSIIFDISRVNQ